MKIGRNDLCPCGSGKKYKKCCMFKGEDLLVKRKSSSNTLNACNDAACEEQLFSANALLNFHKLLLNRKPHIKVYKRIRHMHAEIVDSMLNYFNSGKFECKPNMDHVFENISNKQDNNIVTVFTSEFDMETNVGTQAFVDAICYKHSPNVNCITDDFLNKNRYKKREKVEFLQSMLDSKLGLFEIIKKDSDNGYVYLKEVFTGYEYKITDIALSGNWSTTDAYMYMRILTYHDISFNTGICFIFKKTDPFIKNFITHHKKDYNPQNEFLRCTELYNRYSKNPGDIHLFKNEFNP